MDTLVKKVVRPGMKVEFIPIKKEEAGSRQGQEQEKGKTYLSKVCDVREDGTVEVYMPMEGTRLVLLQTDSEYNVFFYSESSMYQAPVRVADRYKSGNMFIVLVELTGELKKHQRRDYYRLNCSIEMRDRPLTEEERALIGGGRTVMDMGKIPFDQSRIADISGGGIRFIASHRYEVDNWIFCRFVLDSEHVVCARILSSEPVENRIGEYMHRAEYVGMRQSEREKIIRYIFAQEREIRQNRIGE